MREHRFITIERIIKNGFVSFGRNIWLAIAAIAMMSITLTILLFAVISNATFRHTIDGLTSHINVALFLNDSVTEQQRSQLLDQLYNLPNVKSATYISKAETLKTYEKENANNTLLLSAISGISNPLPARLDITPKDPNRLQEIYDFMNKPDIRPLEAQTADDSTSVVRKQAIDNITRATHFFEEAGIVGIIVFIIISMLIIFNTIRMAIFNRRDEVVIMRLLGATPGYIRGPFVVETMIYGVVAALLSVSLCWTLFKIASSTLQASSFGLLDITYASRFFSAHFWAILGTQVGIGIIIGAVSSAIATRRYLRLNK